eukprot:5668094-Pyramimonas_sp.AAC.1
MDACCPPGKLLLLSVVLHGASDQHCCEALGTINKKPQLEDPDALTNVRPRRGLGKVDEYAHCS